MQALEEAGVPPGVVNVIPSRSSGKVVSALLHDMRVRVVSFTGSTEVGRKLLHEAADNIVKPAMELGGNAPFIVFEDADIDAAIDGAMIAKMRNMGEACTAANRFYVHEKVHDEFAKKLTDKMAALKVGNGLDADTKMGPLVAERRLHAMDTFMNDAISKGAKVQTGGKRLGNKGYFYEPTVLTNVSPDSKIMNEEPFGPLAPITPFKDFDGVMKEANRLAWGLAAYAYTKNTKTAAAVGAAFESGMVSINHHGLGLPEVPFGGMKDSGYGSEGGVEALEAYLNTKFVSQLGM